MFSELMRTSNGSPMFVQSNSSASASGSGAGTSGQFHPTGPPSYQNAYLPSMSVSGESALPMPFSGGAQRQSQTPTQTDELPLDDSDDPNKSEAQKLIHYHLDNYKRNGAYCLPSSLRPTLVQKTVPHESVIDGILHPELRDRMILLRGRFDLVDCLMEYRSAVTIHGDDVLAHANWEIGEKWLQKYGYLIDQSTLNIANRWRKERGESEMKLSDIGAGDTPTA